MVRILSIVFCHLQILYYIHRINSFETQHLDDCARVSERCFKCCTCLTEQFIIGNVIRFSYIRYKIIDTIYLYSGVYSVCYLYTMQQCDSTYIGFAQSIDQVPVGFRKSLISRERLTSKPLLRHDHNKSADGW
jgi:hypothetical protein